MRRGRLLLGGVLAVLIGSFSVKAADFTEQTATDTAKRFSAEVQCGANSQDVWRLWCPVTLIGKGAFSAPSTPTTLLGITMVLNPNAKVVPSLQQTTSLAVLTLKPNSARITDLKPSNEQEKQELLQVLMSLSVTLKGMNKKEPVQVSPGLADFLKGENSKEGHSFKIDKSAAVYDAKLPTRLYKVSNQVYGDAYVALEQGSDLLAISIFPTVGFKAK